MMTTVVTREIIIDINDAIVSAILLMITIVAHIMIVTILLSLNVPLAMTVAAHYIE